MTNEEARPASSSLITRREDCERVCGPSGARGHHLLRKRTEREVANAPDPKIRHGLQLKRTWKCCWCPQEFPLGDESADIHFRSFADCQHVMCAEHAHTVGVRCFKFPGQSDLVFGHYYCWHHKGSDLYERRLTEFQETTQLNFVAGDESLIASQPMWISSKVFRKKDPEDDVRVDVISRDVLQGLDAEGRTLIPPIPLDTGLKSGYTCCQCGARDTVEKPLVENCWFLGTGKCQHRFCQDHCKTVGFYNPGGCNIEWCNCHDAVCLPCEPEPWERYPDSDGEYDASGLDPVTWSSEERRRRRHLPQNSHEGSSEGGDDSDSETLMMGGDVVADSDRAVPNSIIG
eukprot:6490993-Amphidinium_carterae.3